MGQAATGLGGEQPGDAVYNLADENIRYFYNNWVALLPSAEDRDRAVRGRLAVESRLATKFAAVLEKASSTAEEGLLRALTEFPLRRGDIYDPEADITKHRRRRCTTASATTSNRSRSLAKAARGSRGRSPRSWTNRMPRCEGLPPQAALLVRDVRFGDVNRIAGPSSPEANGLSAKMEGIPEAIEALRILKPPPPSAAAATGPAARATRRLDEAFFRGYVEPILDQARPRRVCLRALPCDAHAVQRDVLDGVERGGPADPENSLILRKPTSSSETEGVAGSATLAHGGGIRFTKDSPEYATILEWIQGAKE